VDRHHLDAPDRRLATDNPWRIARPALTTLSQSSPGSKEDITAVDVDRITTTYTGHCVTDDALTAAHRRGGFAAALAHAVEQAADAVAYTDADLRRLTASITDRIDTVARAIDAAPGQPAPTLNPLGELQATGPRFDAVIAVRADRIIHLRALVRLWQQLSDIDHTSTP
jgi:hypothetical protein